MKGRCPLVPINVGKATRVTLGTAHEAYIFCGHQLTYTQRTPIRSNNFRFVQAVVELQGCPRIGYVHEIMVF